MSGSYYSNVVDSKISGSLGNVTVYRNSSYAGGIVNFIGGIGGDVTGNISCYTLQSFPVTGNLTTNARINVSGSISSTASFQGSILGKITVSSSTAISGSILATGDITGTVTISNFTGDICAANLDEDNIFCMQPNILPTGVNGVFSGTWTVCGNPPLGMPCPGTSPSPAHQATGVMITKRLSWTAGANTTAYKVYLGTDTSQMDLIGSGPAANCVPPLLEPSTTYYWQVDAVNANGTVPGTVWQFETDAAPTILYVDDDSTASPPDGQSWATAYPNLQDALTAVGTNTNYSLWVAAGTYTPGTLATSTFNMKNGVAIFGGFAGDENPATFDLSRRDFSANETILGGGNVVNHVVTVGNSVVDSVDDRTRLDGFTLAGGIGSRGAAVYAYKESGDIDCDMVFANCVIRDHSGDAVYTFTRYSMYVTYISEPTFMHCQFINNAGRAFYNQRSGVTVLDCTFIGNQSSQNGGVVSSCYVEVRI